MRGSPSLVWGRPAKSVVERPRGFKSHTPRFSCPKFASFLLVSGKKLAYLPFFVFRFCCISLLGLNSPRCPLFFLRVVKSYRRFFTFGLPSGSPESSFNCDRHFERIESLEPISFFPIVEEQVFDPVEKRWVLSKEPCQIIHSASIETKGKRSLFFCNHDDCWNV